MPKQNTEKKCIFLNVLLNTKIYLQQRNRSGFLLPQSEAMTFPRAYQGRNSFVPLPFISIALCSIVISYRPEARVIRKNIRPQKNSWQSSFNFSKNRAGGRVFFVFYSCLTSLIDVYAI